MLVALDVENDDVGVMITYNNDDSQFRITPNPATKAGAEAALALCGITWDLTDYDFETQPVQMFYDGLIPTDAGAYWEQINVQPAASGLPDQTGQSGKFLTTDGTDASWSDKPLVNNTTQLQGLAILGSVNSTAGTAIGYDAYTSGASTAVGRSSVAYNYGSAYGHTAKANGSYSVAAGYHSSATGESSVAIGGGNTSDFSKATATGAIQIGKGTNNNAGTLSIGNSNGNFEMMSADGTIPTARLTKVNTTVTLAAANWSSNTQTVSVTGMTATGVVLVSPDPTGQSAYTSAGIICSAQAAGTLTFTCSTTPTADLSVNVVML